MVLVVFGFSSVAVAQDPGTPDTLYLEVYPGDDSLSGPGPYFVRMLLYVTHDLPDIAQDSIAGTVIPLCYTQSNASMYCSVSAYYNDLCVYPSCQYLPPGGLGIFRHYIDGTDTLLHNWMNTQAAATLPPGKLDWDVKVLDLGDEVSHWWLSLAAMGTNDRRMEDGSRILIATMTFKLEDSMRICIDTCLWPPGNRLQFGAGTSPTYDYLPIIWDEYIPADSVCLFAIFSSVKEISGSEDSRPSEFSLSQNYPNPFNPATNFQFSLSRSVHVRVEIFNIVGQKVRTLVDEQMKPGVYLVDWDGEDEKGNFVSSGIYFYRIQAGDFSDMKKMVLIK